MALRDSVRDVLRTECPPAIARQAITDPDRWRTVWKTVVGLGWTELAPARWRRFVRPLDLAVVLEECGAALAPVPLLSSVGLAAGLLRLAGPAVADALADIGEGVVAALAVAPPGYRLPGVAMTLEAGGCRATRSRSPASPAPSWSSRWRRRPTGRSPRWSGFGDGVTVHAAACTDPAQPVADIDIDAEPIAVAPVDLDSALATPLLAAAADLVGVAAAALPAR